MKIAVAQSMPITGDIPSNLAAHRRFVDLAVSHGAEIIVFPELSITGYEPTLAKNLAFELDDVRFEDFQTLSDNQNITIAIGAPTKHSDGTCISLMLFHPGQARQLYSKTYLHPDEEEFFVRGPPTTGLIGSRANVALAICYELSVPEHAANALKSGAEAYVAGVAKSVGGIDKALTRLSEIAREYSVIVLMANCIGQADGVQCVGRSSVWNKKGELLSQLNDVSQGILVVDTITEDVIQWIESYSPSL